jgi:serine/threonine protein kinase
MKLQCDSRQLSLFLHDRLPADSQRVLEAHLEVCPACQKQLDELAGGMCWWQDVRNCLRDVPDPELEPTRPPFEPPDGWKSDLDFLKPSDKPGSLGRIAAYEILEVIGRGGMGIVLRAFDPALHRPVAIKVLAREYASNGAARKRFAREARAIAAVSHDHIVPVHAVDPDARPPYLVMAYLPGESLQQRLDRSGPLDLKEILRIGMQTAAGLAAAHAQGLVHRDIKPANIMLEKGIERVRITDFGLARAVDDASVTRNGAVAGTPQYMAPEQAMGKVLDQRADLYSLGSTLYAMCTGRAPFRADSGLAVLRQVTDTEPTPIRSLNVEIPAWLEGIVGKLHRKDPDQRFQSAAEVAALLEGCLAHVQQPDCNRLPRVACDLLSSQPSSRARLVALVGMLALVALFFFARSPERKNEDHELNHPGAEGGSHSAVDSLMADVQAFEDAASNFQQNLGILQQSLAPAPAIGNDLAKSIVGLRQQVLRLENELGRNSTGDADFVEHQLSTIRQRLDNLEKQASRFPE